MKSVKLLFALVLVVAAMAVGLSGCQKAQEPTPAPPEVSTPADTPAAPVAPAETPKPEATLAPAEPTPAAPAEPAPVVPDPASGAAPTTGTTGQ